MVCRYFQTGKDDKIKGEPIKNFDYPLNIVEIQEDGMFENLSLALVNIMDLKMNEAATNSSFNLENFKKNYKKRFKTLPSTETLPRNQILGGYIFICNNDTMKEDLKNQLFCLPPRFRDSVRAITPGLPLFLYNYTTRRLHGIFEAASFGGSNIDPTAWKDIKCEGESMFPAQVRIRPRKIYKPLKNKHLGLFYIIIMATDFALNSQLQRPWPCWICMREVRGIENLIEEQISVIKHATDR
ncbi:hypothetical protein M5K25_007166 [Dendrobium thyrsiflorum]|uniref:DCD domain-containing protein n=1 Tax=Dendrobium thyrsiflorum TaxID=117978 RepID=A0ABD0VEJ3_DENTH